MLQEGTRRYDGVGMYKTATDDVDNIGRPVMDPHAHHPLLRQAPYCLACKRTTDPSVAVAWNYNGNGGRPIYRCVYCHNFSCFGDMRGIHLENPVCDCPERPLSRAQVAGDRDRQVIRRAVHYRCAVGRCKYFEYMREQNGEVVTLWSGRLNAREMTEIGF